MSRQPNRVAGSVDPGLGGAFWEGGAQTFVYKGTNGRWTDTLTDQDSQRYEARAIEELGEECATWLRTGVMR